MPSDRTSSAGGGPEAAGRTCRRNRAKVVWAAVVGVTAVAEAAVSASGIAAADGIGGFAVGGIGGEEAGEDFTGFLATVPADVLVVVDKRGPQARA